MRTALQELMMNIYRDDQMDQAKFALESRMLNSKAADYVGMNAANMFGRSSLEDMIAKATDQKRPSKGLFEMMNGQQDIGGHGFLQSIWDVVKNVK